MELSRKGKAIAPSITLSIDAKAKQMKADGIDVVGFGAGEPDFNTPAHVIEAAIKAMNEGQTRYTPAAGTDALRKAICKKLQRDNNVTYEPSQIVVSNGAKHSLFNVFQAICNPGDEVILPAPYWVSYYEMIRMADAEPVLVETSFESNFILDAAAFEKAITPKTKALVLNSPSNPTGTVYNREQLQAIADVAVKHDILVISDEIYEFLIYDNTEHISIASLGEEIKERTIIVNGVSKAYAMTGWRVGYTASNKEIAKIMANYQSHATSNPNSIAQAASIAALEGSQDELKAMVAEFAKRRVYMVERLNSFKGVKVFMPKGAFYVFADISGVFGKKCGDKQINSAMDFAAALLECEQTAVVPGEAFGDKKYIRLSYATSMNNIIKGLDRIEAFINRLE